MRSAKKNEIVIASMQHLKLSPILESFEASGKIKCFIFSAKDVSAPNIMVAFPPHRFATRDANTGAADGGSGPRPTNKKDCRSAGYFKKINQN